MIEDHPAFYTTTDPETGLPALTTLLHRVCGQDSDKFNEACRLVGLFIAEALKEKTK